jgi:hypothetical protein
MSSPEPDVAALIAKGRYAPALELLRERVQRERHNAPARMQLADVLVLASRGSEAIPIYLDLADEFAADGFATKAIALLKKIEKIDANRRDVEQRLSSLLQASRRSGGETPWPPLSARAPSSHAAEMVDLPLDHKPEPMPEPLQQLYEPKPLLSFVDEAPAELPQRRAVRPPEPPVAHKPASWPPPPEPASDPEPRPEREEEYGDPEVAPVMPWVTEEDDGSADPELYPDDPELDAAPVPEPEMAVEAEAVEAEVVDHDEVEPEVELEPEEDEEEAPARRGLDSPLFRSLAHEEALALVQGLELITFDAGDVILTQGDQAGSMFIITTGRVKTFVREPGGRRHIFVRSLGEGEFFGEMALLSGKPRSATITAATPCEVLELDQETLAGITAKHPHVREVLEDIFIERVSTQSERMAKGGRPGRKASEGLSSGDAPR